jgi:uncharacterized protein YgiM (DUF1202 family)
MSFLYNWYEDRRTAAEKRSDAESNVRHYIRWGKISKADELIQEFNLNMNTDCRDEHSNTLLHMATRAKKPNAVSYLLRRGADRTRKNTFGESSWDIAIKNRDTHTIKALLNFQDDLNNLTLETQRLTAENLELRETKDKAEGELQDFKSGRKRKRCDDCEVKDRAIKKVKREKDEVNEKFVKITTKVSKLEKDNQDLTTTVDSLRASFKK